jgi:hypothetical protein
MDRKGMRTIYRILDSTRSYIQTYKASPLDRKHLFELDLEVKLSVCAGMREAGKSTVE